MQFVRVSSLVIGLTMLAQWVFFLSTGSVPELETAPVTITFHITIEIITALMLILVFVFLRKPSPSTKALALYAQGMLGYTVVNSPGYFAQQGVWPFLVMFTAILVFSVMNVVLLVLAEKS